MRKLLTIRSAIYDHFQDCELCKSHFKSNGPNDDAFATCYTARYLIQDTGEALLEHRERGFSDSPQMAYIELWGVLQACVIQQDCIGRIYQVFTGNKKPPRLGPKSRELRDLRVRLAGHPLATFEHDGRKHNRRESRERSFLGRHFGGYPKIHFETYLPDRVVSTNPDDTPRERALAKTDFPEVALGDLIDQYEQEAAALLLGAQRALEEHRFML